MRAVRSGCGSTTQDWCAASAARRFLLPTRSGKIMRRLLHDIAEGRALGDVTTLRDPDVMAQLEGKFNEEQASES